jgi:replicative DNA helicase
LKEPALPNVPFDFEAEAQIIGACVGSSDSLGIAAEMLRPDDFHDRECQKIFRAMLEISAGNSKVTEWALREFLEQDSEFSSASGFSKLAQCSLNSLGGSSLNGACRRVKALSTKRFALYLGNSLAEKACTPAVSTRELLEEFGPKFDALRDGGASLGGRPQHISEIAKELQPLLERVSERRGLMMGVSTGFGSLDRLVPGFVGGELWILGGRPSDGKSALALEFALRQCHEGNSVVLYSLEMSAPSVLLRLACRHGRVDYQRVASGTVSQDGLHALFGALAHVTNLPLWIDPRPVVRAQELRWRLGALAKRENIRLAIVDYLQLLRASGENRTAQVTAISLELKAAARELGDISQGTLLAVAQLNRLAAGEEPQLHHLRESGQIEQDADVVAFLYEKKTDGELNGDLSPHAPGKLLKVAKQRNGPCDKIRLQFFPPFMGFDEL